MTATLRLHFGGSIVAMTLVAAACGLLPGTGAGSVSCAPYDGPDCNELLEIGLDAIALADGRFEEPSVIAIDNLCPPNARCVPGELGGSDIGVIVRWNDGRIGWATTALPPDWPATPPGPGRAQSDPPPQHLLDALSAAASGG